MTKLPAGFELLDQFVEKWNLPTEERRFHERINSSLDEIKEFYDVIMPQIQKVGDYFKDKKITESLDESEQALFYLASSYIEVSRCFEAWSAVDVRADFFKPGQIQFSVPSWQQIV